MLGLYLNMSYSQVHHKSINASETVGGAAACGRNQRTRAPSFREGHPNHQGHTFGDLEILVTDSYFHIWRRQGFEGSWFAVEFPNAMNISRNASG